MKLQSVELCVADVAKTAEFFEKVWHLTPVGNGATRRMRGTAELPYIIALEPGTPAIRSVTFCGTREEIGAEREVKGPEGVSFRFGLEKSLAALPEDCDW